MIVPNVYKVNTITYCNQETFDEIIVGLPEMSVLYFKEALHIDNYLPFGVCYNETDGEFIKMFKWNVYFKKIITRLVNKLN